MRITSPYAFFSEYKVDWQETWREDHDTDEKHVQRYAFVDYEKKTADLFG